MFVCHFFLTRRFQYFFLLCVLVKQSLSSSKKTCKMDIQCSSAFYKIRKKVYCIKNVKTPNVPKNQGPWWSFFYFYFIELELVA